MMSAMTPAPAPPGALPVFNAAQVHAALPWAPLAAALADAFREAGRSGTQAPLRHAHSLGGPDSLLLMPAWNAQAIGVKVVTVMPRQAAAGSGAAAEGPRAVGSAATVQAAYLLLDRAGGVPLVLLDGEALTLRRTAAVSALAARQLARDDSRHLLLVGSGRLAPWMARAHIALRPGLTQVRVWGRREAERRRVADELRALWAGAPATQEIVVSAAAGLEAAVREADIVCCATTSTVPLVRGAWLRPGTHLDLVGGFRRHMREVDDTAVQRSRVFCDTYSGALAEAGDLVQPIESGAVAREHVLGELAQLLRGEMPGRTAADEITLFKSVGTALADLAAAQLALASLLARR